MFQADGISPGYDGFMAFPCLNRGLFRVSKARPVVDPPTIRVSSRFKSFQLVSADLYNSIVGSGAQILSSDIAPFGSDNMFRIRCLCMCLVFVCTCVLWGARVD